MDNLISSLQLSLAHPSFWAIFIAFLAGILTSLTPCVYPIIPIIVSYVGAQSGGSKKKGFLISLLYVLGLALVYSILGLIAALSGSFFGEIQSSFWANFIVGNICLLFALSMFDLFSIQIPFLSRLQPKQGEGLWGAFFLGAVSGLVASPCTAPILGVILTFVATKQSIVYGAVLLFSFAIGMGLLLIVIGTFTGLLTALPKSGAWMVRIKKVFGFILLAIAEYFLIQAGKLY